MVGERHTRCCKEFHSTGFEDRGSSKGGVEDILVGGLALLMPAVGCRLVPSQGVVARFGSSRRE